jgi:hypothetical protein
MMIGFNSVISYQLSVFSVIGSRFVGAGFPRPLREWEEWEYREVERITNNQ